MRAAGRLRRASDALQVHGDLAQERFAFGREPERAMAALEQRGAERRLDRRHLARQRGLREVEFRGGAGERQETARGFEAAQEVERRQASQRLMHDFCSCKPCRFVV